MATLLQDPKIKDFNILAIQEPQVNTFIDTTHHPAKDHFYLYYPQSKYKGPAKVYIFINKRPDHSNQKFKLYNQYIYTVTLVLG